MKNTTAKIISKRLHGWLDEDSKHIPLPNLPDFMLKLAVFSVPESWVPVYKVNFDCDKDHEPAPDGWIVSGGRFLPSRNIRLVDGSQSSWVPVFLGSNEDAIAEADCDCEQCRQARAREERAPFADFDSYVEHLQELIPVMKAVQPLLHTYPDRKLTKEDVDAIIAFDASLKIAEAGVAEPEGRPIYVEPRNVKETLEDVVAGRLTIEDAAALIREAFVAEAEAYGDAHGA